MARNNNSVFEKKGRYVNGGLTEISNSKIEWWSRNKFKSSDTDNEYVLEKIYEGRPDLLSSVLYDDSRLWWIILQFNNIIDINEDFIAGKVLKIPNKDRVYSEFLTGKTGGIKSKRTELPSIKPIK